jgi:surface antigen
MKFSGRRRRLLPNDQPTERGLRMTASIFRKTTATVLVGAFAIALAGCENGGLQANKQTAGTLLGGLGGAVAGAQFGGGRGQLAAVAIGTLLGAYIGSEVGKSLDRADIAAMERTNQQALETGRSGHTSTWRNPDTGHSGTITPIRTTQAPSGEYCREYQQTITVGGRTEQAYGTACRQPDGSWKVVN